MTETTLRNVFAEKGSGLEFVAHSGLEDVPDMARIKAELAEKAREFNWPAAATEILKQLESLLDVDLGAIMCGAWKKYQGLLKYADREKYPEDQVNFVALAEHTLHSDHSPALEIMLNGKTIGSIKFQVSVSLLLKGFILKIQGGRIRSIQTGDCRGQGTVKCADLVLLEKKSRPFSLPGTLELGEGISLG